MPKRRVCIVLYAAILILAGCGQGAGGGTPLVRSPTPNAFCPSNAPVSGAILPLVSPTDSPTQTITLASADIMARIEVETESGHFAAAGGSVAIALLPNTAHHLTVRGTVKLHPQVNGCPPLGGYTVETTTDQQGRPLTIVQGRGTGTRTPVGTPSR